MENIVAQYDALSTQVAIDSTISAMVLLTPTTQK